METEQTLFGVMCLFRHTRPKWSGVRKYVYEERITLWTANSANDAIELAEQAACEYASMPNSDAESQIEYVGYCVAFDTSETRYRQGLEVYSLLRGSDLDANDHIHRFHDTGDEYARHS